MSDHGIELLKELEGHYAYDQGWVDSGVRDRTRCGVLMTAWRGLTEDDARRALAAFIIESYLSEEALDKGYGPEDAAEFYQWLDAGGS